jgi:predicted transcriptional regulator
MKTGYIHIDNTCFSEMHLTPTEAVLYSLVKGYCANGQRFERKVSEVAEQVNMSERNVRYTFNKLCDQGFLTKERKQLGVELKLSSAWKDPNSSAKIAEQERQKLQDSSAKIAEQERQKLPNSPYIINNNNKPNNNGGGEFYGAVLDIFVEHYKITHEGREYTPNFSTMSTAANNIMDNIKVCMTTDKYVCNLDTFRSYLSQWLQLAWAKTDDWHRERWSMEFVNSQFTYFNNLINSKNGNQSSNNASRQQRGSGVSDDYIAQQFAKIARSRAAREAGGDDPTSSR